MRDSGTQSPPTDGSAAPPVDEFAGIPARRTRHPALAAAAVVLAAFLGLKLRGDVSYALSSSTPQDLGDARALGPELPLNRYVRLRGRPDRESALILDVQGSWTFSQFFRLLGTGSRVFVQRVADPVPTDLAEHDTFTGRLVRLRDLSFAGGIRRHFAARVSATHFFAPEGVRAALAAGGAAVVPDVLGQRVSFEPDDALLLDVARPGEVRLELPKERFPELARARSAVEEQGGEVASAATEGDRQVVFARFPAERRDRALSALGDLDRRVRIAPARSAEKVRWRDLAAAEDAIAVRAEGGAPRVVPLAEIQSVRTVAPVVIPDDAVILVEGERPRDRLKTAVVLVFLVAFAAVNLLALRRPA